jgi:hypothetical protein
MDDSSVFNSPGSSGHGVPRPTTDVRLLAGHFGLVSLSLVVGSLGLVVGLWAVGVSLSRTLVAVVAAGALLGVAYAGVALVREVWCYWWSWAPREAEPSRKPVVAGPGFHVQTWTDSLRGRAGRLLLPGGSVQAGEVIDGECREVCDLESLQQQQQRLEMGQFADFVRTAATERDLSYRFWHARGLSESAWRQNCRRLEDAGVARRRHARAELEFCVPRVEVYRRIVGE